MDDQVAKVVAKGPSSVIEAEAEWYIEQAELEFSKPAKTAFLLGVTFAASTARHSWKKTDLYADAKEAAQPAVAYASSGDIATPKVARRAVPAPTRIGDEVDPATIREWLRNEGYQVSERGRISQGLKDVYFAAIAKKTQQAAGRATARASKAAVPKGASAADRRAARKGAASTQAGGQTRTVMPVAAAQVRKSDRLTRNLPAGSISAPRPATRRESLSSAAAQEVEF